MKKIYFLMIATLFASTIQAQSFSDDFEGYSDGDYVGEESSEWTTWSGATGGAEDTQVSTDEAHSGSNSIYFSSTDDGGGPQDVVLPFGGAHSLGQFNFESWFYIESGHGAYFNFQGEETIGSVWALSCYMMDTGDFIIDNESAQVTVNTVPFDEWFKLNINISLTTNVWEIYKNDELIASFANSFNQVASIDIFPLNQAANGGNSQSSFYIDDISYELIPYELGELNAAVLSANTNLIGLAGAERDVVASVKNLGLNEITSLELDYSYDGNTSTLEVEGLSIGSLEEQEFTFEDMITLVEGANDLVVTVSNVNNTGMDDEDPSDDAKTITLDPVVPADGKVVVCEEATGTWCPWCVRGTVMMERATNAFGDLFAGIAVHNADPMTIAEYDGPLATVNGFSGYPGATVERNTFIDPSGINTQFLEKVVVEPAAVLVNGATYDAGTSTLEVSITAEFSEDISGDWRMACVLTENGVTGTTSDYDQANAYAGGGFGEMGGFEDLPSPVPASDMVYDHVARAISPSFGGWQGSFPASVSAGESHTVNFTFILDDTWNYDEIHIVGMLIESNSLINNGSSTSISDAISNGYVDGTDVVGIEQFGFTPGSLQVYPNPANDYAQITFSNEKPENVSLQVIDYTGKVVMEKDYGVLTGANTLPMNLSNLASGIYMIQVQIGQTIETSQLIVD